MLFKVAILFLGGMALIGLIGKWLFPGTVRRMVRNLPVVGAARCKSCGRYLIGRGGCDCKGKG
jgi:hypothetical protein